MRKIYTLILAAIATTTSWADSRSAQQMLSIAQQKLGTNVTEALTVNGAKGSTVENQAYATFNATDGKGFVIVGADDRLPEILGYSTSGFISEDKMPTALSEALQNLNKRLPYLSGAPRTTAAQYQVVEPLLKTKWNQDDAYSLLCPHYKTASGNSGICATGCVATALAQVINYWGQQGKFPTVGKDTVYSWVSSSKSDSNLKEDDIINYMQYDFTTPLDFANMKNYYGLTYLSNNRADTVRYRQSPVENTAVANIMMACGALSKMQYGIESGGEMTYLDRILDVYGFAPGSRLIFQDYYVQDEWDQIIYDQLASGYPIPLCAYTVDNDNGHSFVMDGIDSDGKVHVNWGWGGLSDGFFRLDYLYPDDQGTGGSTSPEAYNYDNQIVINFAPEQTSPVSEYRMSLLDYSIEDKNFIMYGVNTISHVYKDAKMALAAEKYNTTEVDTLVLSLDVARSVLPDTVMKLGNEIVFEAGTKSTFSADLSSLADGWYLFSILTQAPGQVGWSQVRAPLRSGETVYLQIENGEVVKREYAVKDYDMSGTIALDNPAQKMRKDRKITVNATVTNGKDWEMTDVKTELIILAPNSSESEAVATRVVSLKTGEEKSYSFTFTPSETGQYKIQLRGYRPELNKDIFLSNEITIDVDEKLFDNISATFPGDHAQDEVYYCDKPFDFTLYCQSLCTSEGKVTMKMIKQNEVNVLFEDYMDYSVKPGEWLEFSRTISQDVFTESGLYDIFILCGDSENNDADFVGYKYKTGAVCYVVKVEKNDPSAIREISSDATTSSSTATEAYDLYGRHVNPQTYRGIMIKNGKKLQH